MTNRPTALGSPSGPSWQRNGSGTQGLPQILREQHTPQLSAEALLPSSSFRPQQVSMPETTRREEGRVSSSLGRGAAMYFWYTNIFFFHKSDGLGQQGYFKMGFVFPP